ncbi:MAG: Eco57I restriction-modification methylase domain-containing protein [Thermoplasmata archaeon]
MGINFDLTFFENRLKENGFDIIPEKILISDQLFKNINIKESYSLFNNGIFNIIFIYTDKIHKKTLVREARNYYRKVPIKCLLIFSNVKEAILITFPDDPDGEVRILHLEDKLYHTDEEALMSIKFNPDPATFLSLAKNYLPYEKVREEFFLEYRNKYQRLVSILSEHLDEKLSREYAQRFLGRLMFIYFLQKKGWLAGNKDYINKLNDFNDLNELIYNTLNNPNNEKKIPYLNGSLFDREEYLTDELINKISDKMTEFFKEARNFFNRYNFTVDESSPLEVEVSIDPYLLGTVFENMLPENERGQKGTFYTPPAEISFIVRRAISNYLYLNGLDTEDRIVELKTSDGKTKTVLEDGIDRFIKNLERTKNRSELERLENLLMNAKVVDPAVGSGGFLVIYMDEVVNIINSAEMAIYGETTSPKKLKEKILENLYGFDIENEAVEIARLRIWLSYVVDENTPRPLPNLDLNIIAVTDSLESISNKNDLSFYPELKELKQEYIYESDKNKKKELKDKIKSMIKDIYNIKDDKEYIEYTLIDRANIVIMNPPYVRQENIDKDKKEKYAKKYNLDKRSDLYAYFFVRAGELLPKKGVVSVISSDKWLEAEYGISLQDYLKKRLIGVYGQRERTFGADVNTVITVFTNEILNTPVNFVYMEKYSTNEVRKNISVQRTDLIPGKWFYLRVPELFMKKIYPKLTHKLKDFAEIKRGSTTGANDFFYMKDISHLYESDYLANPEKFEEWGVKAKNEKELRAQGLIYIENEGGQKFVINAPDIRPIVRTIKDIDGYVIKNVNKLCLYTNNPGTYTKKYIKWGESQYVRIKGKDKIVKGYNNLSTTSARKIWYSLNELEPSKIILPMNVMDRFFIPISEEPVICDNTLYTLKSKIKNIELYLNSTIFYMTMELYLRRLGGGAGNIKVIDYEQMPVPELKNLDLTKINIKLDRKVKRYFEEVKMEDRRNLDKAILEMLGINDIDLDELYKEFIELVDDRLIKADRPLKRITEGNLEEEITEVEENDEDN